jgi:hypothetical protein
MDIFSTISRRFLGKGKLDQDQEKGIFLIKLDIIALIELYCDPANYHVWHVTFLVSCSF